MVQELKARLLGQTMNEYGCDTNIYLKSEADKVIRHHKYKRCLAMAMWCEAILNQYPSFGEIFAEERRLDKWCKRWLELATKFKEAK